MIDKLREVLPNFPDDVLEDWLIRHTKKLQWPPRGTSWDAILFGKPLEYWREVSWDLKIIDLSQVQLSDESNRFQCQMIDAFVYGSKNMFSRNPDSPKRYAVALKYFVQNGCFPKPICMLKDGDKYSVVDGNHRLAAYWYFRALSLASSPEDMEAANKFLGYAAVAWGVSTPASFDPSQKVWVAVHSFDTLSKTQL